MAVGGKNESLWGAWPLIFPASNAYDCICLFTKVFSLCT